MTLPRLTYARYTDLGGKAKEDAFNASLRTAEARVREIIGFNEPQDKTDLEAYERAVCAGVDVDVFYGGTGGLGESVTSVSLSKFSVSSGSGNSGSVSSYDADMNKAIKRELIGSTLLYQGL